MPGLPHGFAAYRAAQGAAYTNLQKLMNFTAPLLKTTIAGRFEDVDDFRVRVGA